MQNTLSNSSEAAPASPAIYLKNTFLEFRIDADHRIKRGAHSRSFSHDSVLTRNSRATTQDPSSSAGDSDITCWSTCGSSMPSTVHAVESTPSVCSWDSHDHRHHDGTVTPQSPGPVDVDLGDMDIYEGSLEVQLLNGKECPKSNMRCSTRWSDVCELDEPPCDAQDRQAPERSSAHSVPTKHDAQDSCMSQSEVQFAPVMMPVMPMVIPVMVPMTTEQGFAQQPKAKNSKKDNKKKSSPTKPPASNYSEVTTLMMRGIPCKFSQEDLLTLVDSSGLGDKYDFFYMPYAGSNGSNLGYCFINFRETIDAWTFAFTFNGMQLDPARSVKTCTVSPADIQGIKSLRKHFRRTVVVRGSKGPIFVEKKS